MIITQDRFIKDNYDNRTVKLCLRSSVDSSQIRSFFFDVVSTLQFDKPFDCVYFASKKGLFARERTRFLSTPLNYERLLKKDSGTLSQWSLGFMEKNVDDAAIRLSEQMYPPAEVTPYGTVALPPQEVEMRQYHTDGWSDEQLKTAILDRNAQLFSEYDFFTGVRPAAITVRFCTTPLVSLYIEIDKGLLSDDTTRRLIAEWRTWLNRFAAFDENAGSYLGMDNAIMQKNCS